MSYTLSDFDYTLPDELIAKTPTEPRDHSRLLVFDRKNGSITDDYFYNIQKHLEPTTVLVANNSKVEKCRISLAGMELFVLETMNPHTIRALVFPGKKFKKDRVLREGQMSIKTLDIDSTGIRTLELSPGLDNEAWEAFKQTPFPPYIPHDETYADRYQTTYADPLGSKAAPTAGLHFTRELINDIKTHNDWLEVTLHVGLGTFAPVKVEKLEDHTMHSEYYEIPKQVAERLTSATHITAVGTTTARTLESYGQSGHLVDNTDIFITPGYSFAKTNSLITNFHLPKSTLLMMIAAFMGFDEMKHVYNHAIASKYRFYSFGDAMLIR